MQIWKKDERKQAIETGTYHLNNLSHLRIDRVLQRHRLSFLWVEAQDFVVNFLVECNCPGVVEHAQQMSLWNGNQGMKLRQVNNMKILIKARPY